MTCFTILTLTITGLAFANQQFQSKILKLWMPSAHHRCSATSMLGKWNSLHNQKTGDACAKACANNTLCSYAVWEESHTHQCHGFVGCDKTVVDIAKNYVVYKITRQPHKAAKNIEGIRIYEQNYQPRLNNTLMLNVAILSAPENKWRRDLIRKECIPAYAKLIAERKLVYQFVVGRPNDVNNPRKKVRGFKSAKERQIAASLWAEHKRTGDVHFMFSRDTYMDLPTKTLEAMQIGVMRGAHLIVKVDDDMCLNADQLLNLYKRHKSPQYAYIGQKEWRHYLPASRGKQKGADGKFTPYMDGPMYALSFAVAKAITFNDTVHSALSAMYANSNEDVSMGKWVRYVEDKHHSVEHITGHFGHSIGLKPGQHASEACC